MTAAWDIVSDVFPGTQITENKPHQRRAARVPSSGAVAVIVTVCTALQALGVATPLIGGISLSSFTLSRERAVRKGPGVSRAPSEVDFPTARSAEQLARSFQAFFQPAVDHDEDDQVSYVFN